MERYIVDEGFIFRSSANDTFYVFPGEELALLSERGEFKIVDTRTECQAHRMKQIGLPLGAFKRFVHLKTSRVFYLLERDFDKVNKID